MTENIPDRMDRISADLMVLASEIVETYHVSNVDQYVETATTLALYAGQLRDQGEE